jgi:hypothetical protein
MEMTARWSDVSVGIGDMDDVLVGIEVDFDKSALSFGGGEPCVGLWGDLVQAGRIRNVALTVEPNRRCAVEVGE